ncbi:hypothetical protein MCAMS1_01180 [biofilm metagenome]
MKKSRQLFAASLLTIGLYSTSAQATGIPVFDGAAVAKMATTIGYLSQQLTELQNQVGQLKSTHQAMTGNRGYGNFLKQSVSQLNYLPTNWAQIISVLDDPESHDYNGMADGVRYYLEENKIISDADLDEMGYNSDQKRIIEKMRSNTAGIQALAAKGLENASVRFNMLTQLANEIDNTTDPKAIAELQARIQNEQNMLQDEQTKLQQLAAMMQARADSIDQQASEVAILQQGKVREIEQPDLSNIGYGNP